VTGTCAKNLDIRHDNVNAHVVASGVQHDVLDTDNIVPDVSHSVSSTRVVVSDIHQNMLKSRGDKNGQNPAVSTSCTLPVTE